MGKVLGNLFAYGLIAIFIAAIVYLKLAFWGTVIMSAAKPVAQACDVTWKLEKLPLFTGNWFCPEKK